MRWPAARPRAFRSPPGSPIGSHLPMQYMRKKPKGFGRGAQIEGQLIPGQRVLLVEDLATDGRSKVNFVNAIRDADGKCDHCFVMFFYDIYPAGRKILGDLGVTLHELTTWWDVLAVAKTERANSIRRCWPRSRRSSKTRPAGRRRMAAAGPPRPIIDLRSSPRRRGPILRSLSRDTGPPSLRRARDDAGFARQFILPRQLPFQSCHRQIERR